MKAGEAILFKALYVGPRLGLPGWGESMDEAVMETHQARPWRSTWEFWVPSKGLDAVQKELVGGCR